jgi:putative alpha-1,2-mannosidase
VGASACTLCAPGRFAEAPGASAARRYVRGVTLDGASLDGPRITHAQLTGGGTLTFTLRSTPPPEAR